MGLSGGWEGKNKAVLIAPVLVVLLTPSIQSKVGGLQILVLSTCTDLVDY